MAIPAIQPNKIDSLLNAYGQYRGMYAKNGNRAIIKDGINAKQIGDVSHSVKELDRELTEADIEDSELRSELRELADEIESTISTEYLEGKTLAQIRAAIAEKVS